MTDISSVFAKKKAKAKGKKLGINLNQMMDEIPHEEGGRSQTIHNEILGDQERLDGGWVDDEVGVASKKKTVHTGGKQVAEFLSLEELKTVDEVVAEKIYMEDLKREFTEARNAAAKKGEDKKEEEKAKEEKRREDVKAAGPAIWRPRSLAGRTNKPVNFDAQNPELFPTLGGKAGQPVPAVASSVSAWSKAPNSIKLAPPEPDFMDGLDADDLLDTRDTQKATEPTTTETQATEPDGTEAKDKEGKSVENGSAVESVAIHTGKEEAGVPGAAPPLPETDTSAQRVDVASIPVPPKKEEAAVVVDESKGGDLPAAKDEEDLTALFGKKKKKKKATESATDI